MDIDLSGRAALITGGSKGLGFAMARALAGAGAAVTIVARGADGLAKAEAALRAELPAAKFASVAADVSTEAGCSAAVAAAIAAHGPVDILINNAGMSATGPFVSHSDAVWQADLDLKLFAAIRLCRAVLPGMRDRRWGRVINVLAIAAKAPAANSTPTSVSRAAGMALTKAIAGEYAPHNVLVNALLVGNIESDQGVRRHAREQRNISYEEFKAEQGKSVPLGRIGKAEEFAATALFLCSEGAGFIAGTAINVDGGRSPVV